MDIVSASFDDDAIAWYENNGAADPSFTAADISGSYLGLLSGSHDLTLGLGVSGSITSTASFGLFIGDSMRLEPVIVRGKTSVLDLLTYYMGKNTEDRQKFIIDNLRIEEDKVLKNIVW